MSDKNISALLQVLNSEQQIIGRTDQKAFTMLSILGVFMVFFIVLFLKLRGEGQTPISLAMTDSSDVFMSKDLKKWESREPILFK
ncbi:MAG: hypothetical protein HOK52_03765 [Candidatus Marinimicrobia bacterium]|jgi:hypothetical protein|nr:hypothetical protein [Candidatus Neomarinimicrobiota bacterium]MBT3937339.1 hypothetical protein [Candidatus Neomarinimicrobiota bacterium]MBT3961177.1 hypothetical protein [Candidatus Neomarinimicrobiota bacterium]MBT4382175.1 hypothetical protein [Candidatus Neomarinimicrobiota bacterium]MBT4635631.1 hypothetical protein [Candidatus Neomarinimicrobiota bacterium]